MIKPPSNIKTYDAFYSGDAAIISLPKEATDEQRKDRSERIGRARELGESGWVDVVIPGERPTIFTFRPLPSEIYGELFAMLEDARNQREQFVVWALAFRLALVDVKNLDGADFSARDFETHRQFGRIATTDFLDRAGCTGDLGAAIMIELGAYVLFRSRAANPKS